MTDTAKSLYAYQTGPIDGWGGWTLLDDILVRKNKLTEEAPECW